MLIQKIHFPELDEKTIKVKVRMDLRPRLHGLPRPPKKKKFSMRWPFVLIVLLSSPLFAVEHGAYINTSSPYDIEGTALAIGTGLVDSPLLKGRKMILGDMKTMAGTLTNMPITVWIDGEERDARIITRFLDLKDSWSSLMNEKSLPNLGDLIEDLVDLGVTVRTLSDIERRLFKFTRDEGQHVPGTIEYEYAFSYGSIWVTRRTFIEDDHLKLTTHLSGKMQQLTGATLIIDAYEKNGSGSSITGTLYVQTRWGARSKCIAAHIRSLIIKTLWNIEGQARTIGSRGESDLFGAAKVFMTHVSKNGIR